MERLRVLLVEDNPGDARLVQTMLGEPSATTRFEITAVAAMAPAEAAARDSVFDAILLDLGLPDSMGLETATRMLAAAPVTPIVVFSGLNDEETAMEAVRLGVQDYLLKGLIEPEMIRRAIRYAIDRYQTFQVLRHQLMFQQQMIDVLPTPLFYTDAGLALIGCNKAFEDLVGRPRAAMLGGTVYEVLPEGLADHLDEDDLVVGSNGNGTAPSVIDVSFTGDDGGRRHTTLRKSVFTNPEGRIAGLVVNFR